MTVGQRKIILALTIGLIGLLLLALIAWKILPNLANVATDATVPAAPDSVAPNVPDTSGQSAPIENIAPQFAPVATTTFDNTPGDSLLIPADNTLVVEFKGDIVIYVNGQIAGEGPEPSPIHRLNLMLHPGDFLVIRASSEAVYRAVRFAYTGSNGALSFGGKPSDAFLREVSDPAEPAPYEPFNGLIIISGKGDPKLVSEFKEMGLSPDADFIALPEKGVLYDIGYAVPN